MPLDSRFRFENFVVGSANQLAVAAAHAVAESPGTSYNPLFLYGGSGLGKTHLLGAIGNLATQLQPGLTVLLGSLEELIEELHGAIATGQMDRFKEHYNRLDLLLLDDVQFIAGRTETQAEMLRLFNVMQQAGRQIVLTSDRPPAEIADLDERLITRLSGGLIVDIGVPDYETRVAIARRQCEERGLKLSAPVVEELAGIDFTNVRELQGALNRLAAHQALGQGEVTPGSVRALLGERSVAQRTFPGRAPSADGTSAAPEENGEFHSFVFGLQSAVAPHLDAWRTRLTESITYWHELGYGTSMLERALEDPGEVDIEALLQKYEQGIAALQRLGESVEGPLARSDPFRDPERIAEAEQIATRMRHAPPPPGPAPELTRASFEVSASNQMAVRAADAVAESPGTRYNPLLIHGPAGVGKTHLAHAVANSLAARRGGGGVACLSTPEFVDELIDALQSGTVEAWHARYRGVDALVLDDIHVMGGKERSQQELFHLFNTLHSNGRQIVLVSDCPPRELSGVDARLRSRFEGGLVVEIQPPDRALRQRLVRRALTATGGVPTPELIEYLAGRPVADMRELVAEVGRVVQAAARESVPASLALARHELEGVRPSPGALRATATGVVDPFFMDAEKVLWDWPDLSGRAIEDLR